MIAYLITKTGLTKNYHSSGAALVVARDLEDAVALTAEGAALPSDDDPDYYEKMYDCYFITRADLESAGEKFKVSGISRGVRIFPNAGCC